MVAEICGLKTEYTVQGNGKDVLFLHGWGSSYAVYTSMMAALADKCRCTALNFPGCGASEVMKEPFTIGDYANFVLEFIKFAKLENPVLVGHSHGGRVILYMVTHSLINPPKIVLLDSAGLIPKKSLKQKLRAKSFKTVKKVLTVPVWKNKTENLLEKARRHYGSADYNAAPPVLRKTLVNVVNVDLRDRLDKIKCPTLLIWGDKDTATPLANAEIMEGRISDCGLCVIKNTGHFSFCEKPYEANAIIKSFLG